MGSNQFQSEYIEYLQSRNTELLNRLNHMKESYENKILSKDINKHYLISALEDVLNLCTVIPQEIDIFFDKLTAAMGAFKNILLRKSEMVQLVEKISKVINPSENIDSNLFDISNSHLISNAVSGDRVNKKAGPIRVSPMINGHIISTEPRIYLSRVPAVFTPETRNKTHQLSPIIETSPDNSSDPSNIRSRIFREIKIPLERLNLNKMSYNFSEESPKSRFKGPKTWKKSLSSNSHQSDCQKNSVFLENNDNSRHELKTFPMKDVELSENVDPLEGPSWLYEEPSLLNSSSNNFVDYKRRKHRFATVFDKNEECITYIEEKMRESSQNNSNELLENHHETDDEEGNFDETKKRISESSEDFIFESCTSECDENYSPLRKNHQNGKRKRNKKSKDKRDITKINESGENPSILSPNSRNKRDISNLEIHDYSDSSDVVRNEEGSKRSRKCCRKHPLKSSLERVSVELSFEKTPNTSECSGSRPRTNKKSKDSKTQSMTQNETLENDVLEMEDCSADGKMFRNSSKTKSLNVKKKFRNNKSKSKSQSLAVLPQNEGRKKRKAAPSFKLVEPNLITKLRRT